MRAAQGSATGLEVHVGLGERQQPSCPEHLEAGINLPPDMTELGIARISECQHGVLQRLEAGCATAAQELEQVTGIVRRITVPVRT